MYALQACRCANSLGGKIRWKNYCQNPRVKVSHCPDKANPQALPGPWDIMISLGFAMSHQPT